MKPGRIPLAIRIALCCALLCPSLLSSQTPDQTGRLVITSTPPAAAITVNDRSTNKQTPATFIVSPGKYAVSVKGGPENLNCPDTTVTVNSGEQKEVHFSKQDPTQPSDVKCN